MSARLLLACLTLGMSVFTGVASAQQIQLYASIVDSNGKPVDSITPDDVRILENGAEAKITKVETVDWKIKVQILVDNGTGIGTSNLNHLRTGVKGLIEALPEGIEVTLVTTSPQPRMVVKPTTDRKLQLDGVNKIAPDTNVGRFVESLNEATQRIDKDKDASLPVIVSVGSTYGDNRVLDREVNQMMDRLEKHPTTVHVVMVSAGSGSASGGVIQQEIGMNVTKFTRGRYENIAAASRIATLLPEIGAQIAKGGSNQSRQFRVTADRPAGASGPLTKLSMSAKNGLQVTSLTADGRIP